MRIKNWATLPHLSRFRRPGVPCAVDTTLYFNLNIGNMKQELFEITNKTKNLDSIIEQNSIHYEILH